MQSLTDPDLGTFYLLARSAWRPAVPGAYAHRIVLRFFPQHSRPFVVHLECKTETGSAYTTGDYCESLEHALARLTERAQAYGLDVEGVAA